MPSQLPCAYLRVYRPADDVGSVVSSVGTSELAANVRGASKQLLGLISPDERRDAYEKIVDGRRYVCPGDLDLRMLIGLVTFDRSLPDGVVHCFFSRRELDLARRRLAALESEAPDLRPSIVQSAWHAPLRWFVCFDDAERRLEHEDDQPRIRYETTIAQARARVADAFETLKRGMVEHPVIVAMVYELKEWLDSFEPSSLLELDYASVSSLFDADELADDHSAADVRSAIEALASGDGMGAALHYRRANERWGRSRARASLN